MSGIVGCFYRDQRPVTSEEVKGMLDPIQHRGPDGTQIWIENNMGLGHAMLWTTPESLTEQLPYTHRHLPITITADARLDNRSELIEQLDLSDHPPQTLSDSQLILEAYLCWQDRCPDYLLGDFTFILWDRSRQRVFAARDPMGGKPLYYYCTPQVAVLASEIQALLAHPQVPCQFNDNRIAGMWLLGSSGLQPILNEQSWTLFQDISPLPGGHQLVITPDQIHLDPYWQLDPERELKLGSDQEYAEAFRDLFQQAVRCRLRSAFPVGVVVSGGLDSSAVACCARDLLTDGSSDLSLIAATYPHLPPAEQRWLDERPYLQSLADQPGFDLHTFAADRFSPLRDPDSHQIYWHPDEWFHAPNLYLFRHAYHWANQRQIRVMLDGLDGDVVVSHGIYLLQELAQAGRWRQLWDQRRVAGIHQAHPWRFLWSYVWALQVKPKLWRGPLRQLEHFGSSSPAPLLSPALADRTGIEDYRRAQAQHRQLFQSVRGMHYLNLTSDLIPSSLQSVERLGATWGCEPRHPFFDRRLVEFCLSLPTEQKIDHGWTRIVLRRAMAGILPPQIQWRITKAHLGYSFNRGLLQRELDTLREIIHCQSDLLGEILEMSAVESLISRCVHARDRQAYLSQDLCRDSVILWNVAHFAHWLSQMGDRV